jgi:hypothetical protein
MESKNKYNHLQEAKKYTKLVDAHKKNNDIFRQLICLIIVADSYRLAGEIDIAIKTYSKILEMPRVGEFIKQDIREKIEDLNNKKS